ncbi:unnamed protein product [Rhizoctonia solani]|uniref:Uncharacterized protein n=1 Tax=Rhizoctonia solani TaxID=456999 RepID=A0A8H3DI12_9AGAM|nr:unnamed protein product [Rhizoctonia solani]
MVSIFSYAYTIPFPKDSKITLSQAFEALRHKCRAPMAFVPAITSSEVLEDSPTFIKRKVGMRSGVEMTDEIDLYAPTLAVFRGSTGQVVTNLISENAQNERLLTFTFYIPFPEIEPGSEAEAANERDMKEAVKLTMAQSMKTILQMFEEGKLN